MLHLEHIDTNLDSLEKNPDARLEFVVGRSPVMDVRCDSSCGAPRFIVRMIKSLAPISGPVVIETPDREALLNYLRNGFSGIFLIGSYRSAIARLIATPAAA